MPSRANKMARRKHSTSTKQARTMVAAAHDPSFRKRMGIPKGVAEEFVEGDSDSGMLSRAMRERKS